MLLYFQLKQDLTTTTTEIATTVKSTTTETPASTTLVCMNYCYFLKFDLKNLPEIILLNHYFYL